MSAYRARLDGDAIATDNRDLDAENETQQVYLWDIGPERPVQPKRPQAPKGKEGEPEFELAMVEFRLAVEAYGLAIVAHRAALIDYEKFERESGGPVEIRRWSVDAADALERDGEAVKQGRQAHLRYYISARTRGSSGRPNNGLPDGMRPGRGHAENQRREREGEAEFLAIRKADPVFGSEVAA